MDGSDQPSSSSPPGVVSSSATSNGSNLGGSVILNSDPFLSASNGNSNGVATVGNISISSVGAIGVVGPGPQNTTNVHSREESADSGLGLSTNNSYSLPHTPEDYLGANFDDMDASGEFKRCKLQKNLFFPYKVSNKLSSSSVSQKSW